MANDPEKHTRICIIGAGPGGLATAEALRERGYTHIDILEKQNRVGGQALTAHYRGKNQQDFLYELGSLQPLSAKVGVIRKLMQRYHLHTGRTITTSKPAYFKLYSLQKRQAIIDFSKFTFGQKLNIKTAALLLHDLSKLYWILFKYRKLAKPGFTVLPERTIQELGMPFEQWLDAQKFKLIGEDLKCMYGTMLTFSNGELKEEMPAIKLVKFILETLKFPARYSNGSYKPMREGYQELWRRVANNHHVILNAQVKSITRLNGNIHVTYNDKSVYYEKLIISCPANQISKFLDVTPEEQAIFSKVRYNPGWRCGMLARNFPHDAAYAFLEPYVQKHYPPCIAAIVPEALVDDEGTWLYSCVFSHNKSADFQSTLKTAEKMLKEQFNADIIEWLNCVFWQEYSPYFHFNDIKEGIYNKIENLQGKNNTYYVGDIISGGTHSIVSSYAYALVKRFFS